MSITYQYHSTPIIDPNPGHKGAYAKTEKMAEWKMLYNRRIASQRLNGRLKAHRRLDSGENPRHHGTEASRHDGGGGLPSAGAGDWVQSVGEEGGLAY